MEANTVSIKEIINRVKRHPMMETMSEELIIDKAVEFIRILGIPETYDEKFAVLDINEYRAPLPEDCLEVIGVRTYPDDDRQHECYHPIYYRYATGTFHNSQNKFNKESYVYRVNNSALYISTKKGKVEVCYRALGVDDCGFPLIPDNSAFLRALESYIKQECFTILFDQGKLSPAILNNAQQDYAWNVAGVASNLEKLTPDKLASIENIVKSAFIRKNDRLSGLAHIGQDVRVRIH